MDFNGNGVFDDQEKTPISPGSDGGIVIGALQIAQSHSGCPTGAENSPIDASWCFFGNTGAHQTIGTPIVDNGDGTMDFSGWGVTWNGIGNIPLGVVSSNAILNCSSSLCTVNDTYEIDLISQIPFNDPTGFGGVGYALHLESDGPALPSVTITLSIEGSGNVKECTGDGGANMQFSSTVIFPDDDAIESISWTLDDEPLANGESIDEFISLGSHSVAVIVQTVNGLADEHRVNVFIRDTVSPVVNAAFLSKKTGLPISEATNKKNIIIQAEATDSCDPSPVVTATVGAPVIDGQGIRVNKHKGKVKLNANQLNLTVHAIDSAGRSATSSANLSITE